MRQLTVIVILLVLTGSAVVYGPTDSSDQEQELPDVSWYAELNASDAEAALFRKALGPTESHFVQPRRISSEILTELFPEVVFVEFFRVSEDDAVPARNWIAVDPQSGLTCIGARFGNVENLFQMRNVQLTDAEDASRIAAVLDAFVNPIRPGINWRMGEHELREDGRWILNMNTPRPHLVVEVDADGFVESVSYQTRVIPFEN